MGLVQQCARPMVVHNKIKEKELEAVEGTQYVTRESILRRAQEIKGIPLRDVDKTGRLATGKGAIGTVIEESWFGYTPNSESEPDFPEAGVELKVTPYLRGKNGIRAKERLVCNIINYMEEYDKTFQTSAFWHKCNTMLLMSYEHLADKPKGDFRIDAAVLFSFPEEDLVIIEHDWETIIEKVRAGRAHELSEGDTLYLAACTKGANASSVRKQPFSELPAKQRAYADISTVSRNQRVYLYNAGVMMNGRIYSVDVTPQRVEATPLKDILETGPVGEYYFLRTEDMPRWIYAKGAKREKRQRRDGSQYYFSEGSVQFPESLDKPSRTMLTSESQVGRTSHVVQDLMTGRLRVLTPIECERLNGFPDNWTDTGMPERMRYFCMGNALVVPLVKRIGDALLNAGI